jgi:hypothetical protein
VKTECYWKCYSYGDDLIPIFEFIDDLRNRSVKELLSANSEQTEEHIEKQDKVRLILGLSVGFFKPNFNSILLCDFLKCTHENQYPIQQWVLPLTEVDDKFVMKYPFIMRQNSIFREHR